MRNRVSSFGLPSGEFLVKIYLSNFPFLQNQRAHVVLTESAKYLTLLKEAGNLKCAELKSVSPPTN